MNDQGIDHFSELMRNVDQKQRGVSHLSIRQPVREDRDSFISRRSIFNLQRGGDAQDAKMNKDYEMENQSDVGKVSVADRREAR